MRKIYASSFVPQNYLAEEILLGTILVVPRIFPNIIQLIQPNFFFLESNQIIYLNIKSIYQENKLNSTELINHLINNQNLHKIGGINKLINIMSQSQVFISTTNLNIYLIEIIETIKINYIKRLLIQYGHNIIELAHKPTISSYQVYNKASNYLNITNDKLPITNLQNFHDLIGGILLDLKNKNQQNLHSYQISSSIPSGFIEIDKLTNGLPKGDLIIIAGRPSTGKTSLVINIILHILKTTNHGIYIFSLEMSRQQIIYKCLSILNQLSINDINKKNLNYTQITNIQKTCQYLLHSSLYINDTPNTSIDYIEYTTKLLKHHHNILNILIIDYLQLIHINTKDSHNRVQELSYITRKLKILAQYLSIPVVVLSQLNRNIETRVNKKPLLSDLRESGCIIYRSNVRFRKYYKNNKIIKNILLFGPSNRKINYLQNRIKSNTVYNIEYIFHINTYQQIFLNITYNHKLLNHNKWSKQYEYLENFYLTSNIKTKQKNYFHKQFIKAINFNIYNKTYDIAIYNYQCFKKNTVILHNSIEQDADIVMMIYEPNSNLLSNSCKTIDIIIGKNRNGPIGLCSLMFNTNTTTFKNIHPEIN